MVGRFWFSSERAPFLPPPKNEKIVYFFDKIVYRFLGGGVTIFVRYMTI